MKLSKILCSSPEEQDAPSVIHKPAPPCTDQEHDKHEMAIATRKFSCMPDKERKRPHRLSTAQRQRRRENEAYTSRVQNLMLDINDLRQQIRFLMERRDLHITSVLLCHRYNQSHVLDMAWHFLFSLRSENWGLSQSEQASASGGLQEFVVERGRPAFTHRSLTINAVQLLAFVDNKDTTRDATSELRTVCVAAGGCVVEVLATFTGRINHDTLVSLAPHVLSDEVFVSRLIGTSVTFSPRLLLYFDAQVKLVRRTVQADFVGAFQALSLGE